MRSSRRREGTTQECSGVVLEVYTAYRVSNSELLGFGRDHVELLNFVQDRIRMHGVRCFPENLRREDFRWLT
jgi:hypothetical protein